MIYNASIVGQAKTQLKGKISRTLANKCALCSRFDALGENQDGKLGSDSRAFMEKRLKLLESGGQVISGATGGQAKWAAKGAKQYNASNDFTNDGGQPYKRQKL